MKHLTLNVDNPLHRRLALRILDLAKINPYTVSAEGFTVYKNHVVFLEIYKPADPKARGAARVLHHSGSGYVKKQRVIRNPLPASAWQITRRPAEFRITVTLSTPPELISEIFDQLAARTSPETETP